MNKKNNRNKDVYDAAELVAEAVRRCRAKRDFNVDHLGATHYISRSDLMLAEELFVHLGDDNE